MKMAFQVESVVLIVFGLAILAVAQFGNEFDYGQSGDAGITGLSDGRGQYLQQYNFASAPSFGVSGLENFGVSGGLLAGNIGIPSEESITQLGRAISEGGVPSGTHGEIATPTQQPPPRGEERRAGIVARLIGGGFLSKR